MKDATQIPFELFDIPELIGIRDYLATDVLDIPGLMIEAEFAHSSIDDCVREILITYLDLLNQTSPYLFDYFPGPNGMDIIHVTKLPTYFDRAIVGRA